MLSYFDCQAQTIGTTGFAALSAPGSSVSLVLSVMLTLLFAITGYRMLAGEAPTLRSGLLLFAKIGLVLAFASNWSAYRSVIYDAALQAPGELAGEIGQAAGVPGASGGLPSRLDSVDQTLRRLSAYGAGVLVLDPVADASVPQEEQPPWSGFDTFAIGASRLIFLGSVIGSFALVRLSAGLLLALGPLFFAFVLFDATRGLFLAWAQALVGSALAGLAIVIGFGVELALLEPWLTSLVSRREAGEVLVGVPTPLLATTSVFALVLASMMIVVARIAGGLGQTCGFLWSLLPERPGSRGDQVQVSASNSGLASGGRSRVAVIVDEIAATQRREERQLGGAASGQLSRTTSRPNGSTSVSTEASLGRSFRRRASVRASNTARLRDER